MIDIADIKQYIARYEHAESKELIEEGVTAFLQNHVEWKEVIAFINGSERGEEIYGNAFIVFSVLLYKSESLNDSIADYVSKEIRDYESRVDYQLGVMYSLYFNMGLIWHKLGDEFDVKAVEEFKKAIYYSLALSNNTSYSLDCYAFRPCSKYLYHSLVKEQLNVSSPTQFNDPFDCPILDLLDNHGDDVSKLIHKAYRYTTKVACFVKNDQLPTGQDFTPKPKQEGIEPEYLNELMWAHYADAHKGVCIKYHFPNAITRHPKCGQTVLAYFRDVRYSNDVYNTGKEGTITMHDAFFLKSKAWEYENEVRYLYFDHNGNSDYAQVNIPDCVSAVYFGLKCPEEERQFIMKLLEGKKWVHRYVKLVDGIDKRPKEFVEEKPIEFYQIRKDGTLFGKLIAEKIGD